MNITSKNFFPFKKNKPNAVPANSTEGTMRFRIDTVAYPTIIFCVLSSNSLNTGLFEMTTIAPSNAQSISNVKVKKTTGKENSVFFLYVFISSIP